MKRNKIFRFLRAPFTLVEILVVVAIIAILMGILIPVVLKYPTTAKITKTKSQMNSINVAIKQYEAIYGYLPSFGNMVSNASNYRQFFAYLTCVQGPNTTVGDVNGKKNRFLEVPSNYGNYTTDVSGTMTNAQKGDFQDPWGNLFRIYLDTNYDGAITSADAAGAVPACVTPSAPYSNTVLIYSLGPNKIDDGGRNSMFGEGKGYDDVCSWR
ncbi:MAG: hypothetical protein A2017_03195 [Lentisphaerae bacterium GWF2_44_16]|nr:MAG: hypothetical protein A2017_03195 [Lentisphaerae bacterium GWF2_44_16]